MEAVGILLSTYGKLKPSYLSKFGIKLTIGVIFEINVQKLDKGSLFFCFFYLKVFRVY
jgi:hypothetical protein